MILNSQKMMLKVMRIVQEAETNDIFICQDLKTEAKPLYTVWRIKKHDITHRFLQVFEESGKKIDDCCVDFFTADDNFVVVFPYVKERSLDSFFVEMENSLQERENVCVNIVVNVMTNELPYPLMYLALKQRQLNIAKDNSVYLGNLIDLSELDKNVSEKECVVECARVVSRLLATNENAMSYELIQKKISRASYSQFAELYKDIRMAAAPEKKRTIWTKLKAWFRRNKDRLFKMLFVVSVILAVVVILSFLTNVIWGDIPWLRLFFGKIKSIGTESMLQ